MSPTSDPIWLSHSARQDSLSFEASAFSPALAASSELFELSAYFAILDYKDLTCWDLIRS